MHKCLCVCTGLAAAFFACPIKPLFGCKLIYSLLLIVCWAPCEFTSHFALPMHSLFIEASNVASRRSTFMSLLSLFCSLSSNSFCSQPWFSYVCFREEAKRFVSCWHRSDVPTPSVIHKLENTWINWLVKVSHFVYRFVYRLLSLCLLTDCLSLSNNFQPPYLTELTRQEAN